MVVKERSHTETRTGCEVRRASAKSSLEGWNASPFNGGFPSGTKRGIFLTSLKISFDGSKWLWG